MNDANEADEGAAEGGRAVEARQRDADFFAPIDAVAGLLDKQSKEGLCSCVTTACEF